MYLHYKAQIFREGDKRFQPNSFKVYSFTRLVYRPGNLFGTYVRPIKIEVVAANDKRKPELSNANVLSVPILFPARVHLIAS